MASHDLVEIDSLLFPENRRALFPRMPLFILLLCPRYVNTLQ
jgi:hypothetical protein